MRIVCYSANLKNEWDAFVVEAKNSTFLFMRDYMDYHSDRFVDKSLLFYDEDELCALLPANYCSDDKTVVSHGGLTYGGFILSRKVKGSEVLELFRMALDWMKKELGASLFVYKPLPQIYSLIPSQEDLYSLFRFGARLVSRSLSSVINNNERLRFSTLRCRKIAKAAKNGVCYMQTNDFVGYWRILSDVLMERHGCRPVHSLEEISLLHSRFPNNIKLYAAYKDGKMLAGCVVYETVNVAHFQYIASSSIGKTLGALDGLFAYLFDKVYYDVEFIDFGISTENGGHFLNEGLLFQKEGFGGRGIVYDVYEIDL